MAGVFDGARGIPAERLRPYVASYEGYLLSGFDAGTHIGMPSPFSTVILTIDSTVTISNSPRQGACTFRSLASGISAEPVTIAHDGFQHGIQLALTPAGARALFGVPTAALGDWMVELSDVLPNATELVDRIGECSGWEDRFDVLDDVLGRALTGQRIDPTLTEAWRRLVLCGGEARVGDVAREVGWSRRHLVGRFTAEFGVGPKESAKIARFSRSHRILRQPVAPALAEIAATCGYYDQAHMARDWRDLAGVSPTQWRADELFTFVQDTDDSMPAG